MKFNMGLAQINPRLGDLNTNLEKHLQMIDAARAKGVDLLIFPELSLTGYVLQDLAASLAIPVDAQHPVFASLLQAAAEMDLVVGFVHEDIRHRFFIAAAYLSRGKIVHVHDKIYLPTYGMFDESRFFAWGDNVRAFDTRFGRAGILICEDFWHASSPYLLWQDGADLFIFTSASPGRGLTSAPRLASSSWVEHTNRAYAGLFTAFVAHTNRVGYEDGLHFWGGSTIFDPDGNLIIRAEDHNETLAVAEVDMGQLHRTRERLPLLRDERGELMRRELDRIARKND